MAVIRMATQPTLIVCARELQNSINDSVHSLIHNTIKRLGLADYFKVTDKYIECVLNGSMAIFKGLRGVSGDASAIKSLEGADICWIEEAQTVSRASLDTLKPTIRKKNSEIWITFNPKNKNDPVYDDFITNTPSNAIVKQVNYWDNPHFHNSPLREEMEELKARDYARYLHIWEGQCLTFTDAQIFKDKFVVQDFEPLETWSGAYYGLDFGFSQDPTAGVRLFIADNRLYIRNEAVKVGLELDHTAQFLTERLPDIERHVIRADSARPESISYLKRHGLPLCTAVAKGKGSVEDGVEFIKSFDKVVIHPDGIHSANEFANYSYKVDRLSGDVLPTIDDNYNHVIDAIRYALEPIMKARQLSLTKRKSYSVKGL